MEACFGAEHAHAADLELTVESRKCPVAKMCWHHLRCAGAPLYQPLHSAAGLLAVMAVQCGILLLLFACLHYSSLYS